MSVTLKRFLAVVTATVALFCFAVFPLSGCTLMQTPATSYTVRFDSNGGTAVAAQTVAKGERVKRPTAPTKTGRIFVDWYKDTALTTVWSFDSDTVSRDMVLHAGWRIPGSDVVDDPVDDPDDSDDDDDWITPDPGGDDDNPGGNDDPGGNGDNPGGGDDPVDPLPDGASVTATFNVGIDARKDGLSNPPAQNVKSGAKLTAPNLSRGGYTLAGWYVENGERLWNFGADKITNNTTLFAKWTSGGGTSGDREDYTPSMTNADTLYIHYRRTDGNYDGWAIWAWKTGGSGARYASVTTDKSGTVIAIDLDNFDGATQVNFIVTTLGADLDWDNCVKDGGDNVMRLSAAQKIGGSYHWYVDEDNVSNGNNYLSKQDGGGNAGAETEPLRASRSTVDRSYAQGLAVKSTVSGWDEVGVGYQIFVASFCDSDGDGMGDLRGIISKLDYIKNDIHADVLWLTPIQSSDSSHGYDCYDYYAIDPKFGTNADYRELVSKAHQRGIKVIMDLVVNHTSRKNEWFIKSKKGVVETVTYQDGTTAKVNYRDFYRWRDHGNGEGDRYYSNGDGWYFYSSFGDGMPELNYDYQPVRDAMADVAAYWMGYGLDGFRMDAIKHVYMWGESDDTGCQKGPENDPGWEFNVTKNVEFFKEFNHKLKTKYPHCFLLGEQLSGDERYVAPFYQGMDSLFDFNTYYNLPTNIKSGSAGLTAAKLNANARLYATNRGDRPINSMISSNHDITRLYDTALGGDKNKIKLYFAVIMTMPGISWVYYGDEIGMTGACSGDGDQKWRQPMRWTSDWQYACDSIPGIANYNCNGGTVSVADQLADSGSLLSYVKSLTALRDAYPALVSGEATCSEYNGMMKTIVTKGGQTVTVYHNFTRSTVNAPSAGSLVFGSADVAPYGTAVYVA